MKKTKTWMKEDEKLRLEREKQSSYQEKKNCRDGWVELPGEIPFFLNFHSPPDKNSPCTGP
jgi:hypothetical protein